MTATIATSFEVFPIVSDMLDTSVFYPKLFAIEPIIRAIEGSIKPAIMAPRVPMASIQLSFDELYEKNRWIEMVYLVDVSK